MFDNFVISPIWGFFSTWFFFQIWLCLVNALISAVGFVLGRIPRKLALGMTGLALLIGALFSVLLQVGSWLVATHLHAQPTRIGDILYWSVAGLVGFAMVREVPSKFRKYWRNATIAGSIEQDIALRASGRQP